MDLAGLGLLDVFGLFIGFILTLFVFSYLLGDNILFRIAIHIFVGVATGYTVIAVIAGVLWPQLIKPLLSLDLAQINKALIPILLSGLLLLKAFPRLSGFGKPVVAYLVGIAAAVAIGGAVMGTIFPQTAVTINLLDIGAMEERGTNFGWGLFNGLVILIGTVSSLAYFHFGVQSKGKGLGQRVASIEGFARVGQIFIAITFGAIFAGIFAAALVALVERWKFIYEFVLLLLQ